MKSPLHFAAALAVSFTLLSHGSAMAAGNVTASISNVQLGVLDLTPNDGIAAGYGIDVFSSRLTATLTAPNGSLADFAQLTPDPYQSSSVRVDRGSSFAQTHTGGAIGDLTAEAAAYPNLAVGNRLSALHDQSIWLTLRPHTLLTVGGDFDLLAQRASDGGKDYLAEGYVTAEIYHEQSNSGFSSSRSVGATPVGSDTDAVHDDFFLTYANGTDHDMQVLLNFDMRVEVSTVPTIPEPGTWSMLGAGLVVLGAAARGRRRQG